MIEDVIRIDTNQATKSVKELRAELKNLKDQMINAKQGSEQYNQALVKAAGIQKQLKDQMQEVNNSAMDFGQYMGNAGKAMAGMTGAVTAATAAMNLFGVENEEAAQAVTATMSSLIGLTQGLMAIDSGVKAFRALTIAINASVAGMNALKLAIAATGIGALVVLIATVAANWDKWFSSTKKENEALERAKYLVQDLSDDIKDQERIIRIRVGTAKNEGKAESELIKIRQEGIKEILNQIQAAKRKIAQDAENISSMKKLKELQEQMNKLLAQETAYRDKLADSQIDEGLAIQAEQKQTEKDIQSAADNARTIAANLAKYELEMAKTKLKADEQYSQKAYDLQMKYFDRLFSLYGKDSEEYRNTLLEKTQYINDFNKHYEDIYTDFQNSRKTEEQLLDERYKMLMEAAEKTGQDTSAIKLWYEEETHKKEKELLEKFYAERKTTEIDLLQDALDERYRILIAAAEKEGQDTLAIQNWYIQESQRLIDQSLGNGQSILDKWNQSKMTDEELELQRLDEFYTQAIDAALAKETEEGQLTNAIYEDYQKKKNGILKKYEDQRKKDELTGLMTYGKAVGGLLSNISDMMEEGTAAQKGMATAAATVQMLVGITSALAGVFTTKSGPWDLVLAGIQAASIAAAGIANIQKIQQVKEDGSGAGSSGGSYVPSISIPSVVGGSGDFTQTVDGAMTETAIADQKVYVLESDITDTQKKVEVNESAARF